MQPHRQHLRIVLKIRVGGENGPAAAVGGGQEYELQMSARTRRQPSFTPLDGRVARPHMSWIGPNARIAGDAYTICRRPRPQN
jgi:hypothetical protein